MERDLLIQQQEELIEKLAHYVPQDIVEEIAYDVEEDYLFDRPKTASDVIDELYENGYIDKIASEGNEDQVEALEETFKEAAEEQYIARQADVSSDLSVIKMAELLENFTILPIPASTLDEDDFDKIASILDR